MIRTVTDLIKDLARMRDAFSSFDIPISVDGKDITRVELVNKGGYQAVIKTRSIDDSEFPRCPYCGSYNYEVGFHSSAHNCKCRDCGTLFFWNFNM